MCVFFREDLVVYCLNKLGFIGKLFGYIIVCVVCLLFFSLKIIKWEIWRRGRFEGKIVGCIGIDVWNGLVINIILLLCYDICW